jgi:hypothetical protein
MNFLASSCVCISYRCLQSPVFEHGTRNQCMHRRRFKVRSYCCEKRLLTSWCISVRQIFTKFYIGRAYKIVKKIRGLLKSDRMSPLWLLALPWLPSNVKMTILIDGNFHRLLLRFTRCIIKGEETLANNMYWVCTRMSEVECTRVHPKYSGLTL